MQLFGKLNCMTVLVFMVAGAAGSITSILGRLHYHDCLGFCSYGRLHHHDCLGFCSTVAGGATWMFVTKGAQMWSELLTRKWQRLPEVEVVVLTESIAFGRGLPSVWQHCHGLGVEHCAICLV